MNMVQSNEVGQHHALDSNLIIGMPLLRLWRLQFVDQLVARQRIVVDTVWEPEGHLALVTESIQVTEGGGKAEEGAGISFHIHTSYLLR